MFRRPTDARIEPVSVRIDGQIVPVNRGDSVAAALIAAGVSASRTTPVNGNPRAPYCMMGVCFDCLVRIDGIGNRQACMERVREGMVVELQHGRREAGQ